MHLSAVMCTRNRAESIARAVGSVLASTHPDFDMVVIDQSDTNATREALEELLAAHSNLVYVHTTRVGLSAAYNAGIARGTGEIIAFTDDDCVAPPDWLERVEAAFAREPDAELLYGRVAAPSELRGADGVLPVLNFPSRRISKRDGFMVIGMGANFAARRRLFEKIGGFDEVLGGGGPLRSSQDFDLQYRVYRAGLVTLLAPEVTVDHYGIRNSQDWPKTLTAYGVGDGGFYMKHMRCGDRYAAWLLTRKLAREAPRALVKTVLRRPSNARYVLGIVQGSRESFRFGVDRDRRIYTAS